VCRFTSSSPYLDAFIQEQSTFYSILETRCAHIMITLTQRCVFRSSNLYRECVPSGFVIRSPQLSSRSCLFILLPPTWSAYTWTMTKYGRPQMCNKLATLPFLSVPSVIPTTFHSRLPSQIQTPPPNSLTRAESLHCVRLSWCRYA